MLHKPVGNPAARPDVSEPGANPGNAVEDFGDARLGTPAASPGPAASGRSQNPFISRVARVVRFTAKALLPFAVLAAGWGGYQYLKATRPEPPKQAQTERVFAVTMHPVKRQTLQPTLKLYGTTVAGREFDIRALVSGRVITTSDELREGGLIGAGQSLITIDPFDYRTALEEAKAQRTETSARIREQEASLASEKRSLEHARSQLALAEADLERAVTLAQRGNLSEKSVDDRRQILLQRQQAADQTANSLAVWEARIAQSKAAVARLDVVIERAGRRLEETVLTAPFDAYVTEVSAQTGRMVGINDKIAKLIDRAWIEARFTLTDSQYGRLIAKYGRLEGRKIELTWRLGSEAFRYAAEVSRIGAQISSSSGGIDVFARIIDPTTPTQIRPGAFVEIEVPDVRFDDVVQVPNAALYDGDTVYVAVAGRLDPRKVEIVGTAGSDLLLRGPLNDGERIVTTRLPTPGKGVAVKEAAVP
ncbi:MAG: HlyD family efflux transporter periplasmic adaptor subunit [Hyphomicrobiaceae bacterium]|nr:HlyD family efflux transporter periplasmic adaptor subunit [Hyphomicrobiaceae bacterium]